MRGTMGKNTRDKIDVGRRLREARKEEGLTQAELGRGVGRTGVDQTTIGRWERSGEVPADKVDDLADELGVPSRWLEAGEGAGAPASSEGGAVSSSDDAVDWIGAVTSEDYRDDLRLTLASLPGFRHEETWIVSTTPEAVAEQTRRDIDTIKAHWEDVMKSPYVERIGVGRFTFRLIFPNNA